MGRRTGPLTRSCLSFARLIKSVETTGTAQLTPVPLSERVKARTLLEVLDVAACERDADLVDLGGGHGGTSRVVLLFTLSDVTHPGVCW